MIIKMYLFILLILSSFVFGSRSQSLWNFNNLSLVSVNDKKTLFDLVNDFRNIFNKESNPITSDTKITEKNFKINTEKVQVALSEQKRREAQKIVLSIDSLFSNNDSISNLVGRNNFFRMSIKRLVKVLSNDENLKTQFLDLEEKYLFPLIENLHNDLMLKLGSANNILSDNQIMNDRTIEQSIPLVDETDNEKKSNKEKSFIPLVVELPIINSALTPDVLVESLAGCDSKEKDPLLSTTDTIDNKKKDNIKIAVREKEKEPNFQENKFDDTIVISEGKQVLVSRVVLLDDSNRTIVNAVEKNISMKNDENLLRSFYLRIRCFFESAKSFSRFELNTKQQLEKINRGRLVLTKTHLDPTDQFSSLVLLLFHKKPELKEEYYNQLPIITDETKNEEYYTFFFTEGGLQSAR